MPDSTEALPPPHLEFIAAKAAVVALLERLGVVPLQPLSAIELRHYKGRHAAAGWRLPIRLEDGVRRFDLLLPQGFPWEPVRVALVDRPAFLTWPHVEKDGVLCLATDSLEVNSDDPAGVAAYMLDEAIKLISAVAKGQLAENFHDEILSYWSNAAAEVGVGIISLVGAAPPSRMVKVWRGEDVYVMAETEVDLSQWLANRYGTQPSSFQFEDAAFLWLTSPPIPSAYPSTGSALREMVGQAGSETVRVLSDAVRKRPDNLVCALGMETRHGPALVGVVVPKPGKSAHGATDPLTKGFRPGMVPDQIALERYLGSSRVSRRCVERADPDWVHGRGHDPRAVRLRNKTVAIIGCGSVGGAIAVQLAQAGVGRLVLVDPDILKWANIGRHALGGPAVGRAKSVALGEKLRRDFPSIKALAHILDADTFLREQSEVVAAADLVVSATGSWVAERRIDAWQHATQQPVPVLYGWLEAHASAGHALLIGGPPDSIRYGFDETGLPRFSVTTWGQESTQRHEPGCGATFQPYGPTELSIANGVIANLVLDALLRTHTAPIHRIWVASKEHLDQAGGKWSDNWHDDPLFRPSGGFTLERSWPRAGSEAGEVTAI